MTIEVLNESGLELDDLRTQRLARFVMDRMRVHPLAELCVTAVDEATIAELNAKWMEKEGPTDVLAFPMDELRPGLVNDEPEEGVLGDIVLCPSMAADRRRRRDTPSPRSSTCSPCTASCTSSATTMPSPRSTRRCSACRRDCSPSGSATTPIDPASNRRDLEMNADSPGLIAAVVALVVLAAVLTTIEAALSSFSRARAVELAQEQRPGAIALLRLLDDAAHHLNALLVVRLLAETSAVVLSTAMVLDVLGPEQWTSILAAIGLMFLMLFVVVWVGPRTIGRQRSEGIALSTAGIVLVLGRIMGPVPKLLILIGNAITPGKGFSEGPFSSEAELREMVDLAEASSLIESGESKMIHSVFELGDTSVREVMVPRTDVVYIERTKTLRQAMSLFLRSGFSRVPGRR